MKQPINVKTEKITKAKRRIRRAKISMGRKLIMQIGTMSALLEFLGSRLRFNLLCKHFYRVVMPGIISRFPISHPDLFGDWL